MRAGNEFSLAGPENDLPGKISIAEAKSYGIDYADYFYLFLLKFTSLFYKKF
jgi:hypothetical protein